MRISFCPNIPNNLSISPRKSFCGTTNNIATDTFVRSSNEIDNKGELNELLKKESFDYYNKINKEEENIIKTAVPTLRKARFTKDDYDNLSGKERAILNNLICKGENVQTYCKSDYSIAKDAERVLEISQNIKSSLDEKYPNGYKLVSIGNSATPFIETMQLLGADTVVMPFSRSILRGEFPFSKKTSYSETPLKYKKDTWVNYLNHFGINSDFTKNSGKQLIFTDYEATGFTTNLYIKPLLENLDIKENTEIINILELIKNSENPENENLCEYDIHNIINKGEYKKFSIVPSAKNTNFNVFLHPELINKTMQPIDSKLFRYALYKQLEE